jgi:hypothetical protein
MNELYLNDLRKKSYFITKIKSEDLNISQINQIHDYFEDPLKYFHRKDLIIGTNLPSYSLR